MDYLYKDDYLAHTGKKGMRWGIRHDRQRSSSGKRKYDRKDVKQVKSSLNTYYRVTKSQNIAGNALSKAMNAKKPNKKRVDEFLHNYNVLLAAKSIADAAVMEKANAFTKKYGEESMAYVQSMSDDAYNKYFPRR